MKRLLLVALTTVAVSLSAMPVLAGAPPTDALGTWDYVPDFEFTKFAGSNSFVSGTDVGTWHGTFEGTSYEEYVAVFHKSHGTYQGLMEFVGEVDDRHGTLIIKTNGSGPLPPLDWSGTWVIMSGTDDLANLRGQGTWHGDLPNLTYEGKVHFTG